MAETAQIVLHLQNFDFQRLFNELGWNNPATAKPQNFTVDGETYTRRNIAELAGIPVFEIIAPDGRVPERKTRRRVHTEISKHFLENLIIFVDVERTQSFWHWIKREKGAADLREHDYFRGQPVDLMLSKIVRMNVEFSEFDEEGNLPVVRATRKLAEALDIEKVTRKFYEEFDKQHIEFLAHIEGINDERDRRWYASVVLNRLMFIYFLSEKGFLDNGRRGYLQYKLEKSKETGADLYFDNFLKKLFFIGFALPENRRSEEDSEILGKIPYLNGGLFLRHRIEIDYPNIQIADAAFENIYDLFGRYSWNLDDAPGGKADEINPDVLGYIFEKYINQKAFGAYYTRPEITQYLCEETVYKLILDQINSLAEPASGKTPDMFSSNAGSLFLNKTFDSMADLLINLDEYLCAHLWNTVLPGLKLLDPACGSGAFLVAAMKTLLNVYSAIIGRMEILGGSLKAELDKIRSAHSLNYFIKRRIINDNLFGVDVMEEATEIAKLRLFMTLVSSVNKVEELEPLPNIDFNILAGNSLVGLLHVADKEFDARHAQGNLFRRTYRELVEIRKQNIKSYRRATSEEKDLQVFRDEIKQGDENVYEILNEILLEDFNRFGIKFEQATWDDDKAKEGKPIKRAVTIADIKDLHPFHWGYEFDEIINERGGFDAIITNPPWEIFKPNSKEFFEEHELAITGGDNTDGKRERVFFKKKMTIKEFEAKKDEILKSNPEVLRLWLEYLSRFPHVSLFYRNAPNFKNQISIVNGKRQGTDINLYKLFLEQCFNLLRPHGRCGIIVQGGVYTDLGAKQLREMLFTQSQICSLFGLSNEKFIFENVHHAQKFCILTFEKGEQTQKFEAAFRINPREAVHPDNIEQFLRRKTEHIQISVPLVRRLSPNSLSLMEFKNEMDVQIAEKMLGFPLAGEKLEGKWNLTLSREFDMTNDSYLFKTSNGAGRLALQEGKMIHQFRSDWGEPRYWLDEEEAGQILRISRAREVAKVAKSFEIDWEKEKEIDKLLLDYKSYRLAFRDVTGSVNERTMIMTVLPPNRFCPHTMSLESVYSIRIENGEINPNFQELNHKQRLFVCAIMNSFVIDAWLRRSVGNHLSFFFVYTIPLPRLTEDDKEFAPIVERAAKLICTTPEFDKLAREVGLGSHRQGVTNEVERARLRAELDALVAHLYGLTEAEFAYILTTFPLVSDVVKVAAQNAYRDVETGLIKYDFYM